MREFTIRRGRFAGLHFIYDSREEFLKTFPDKIIKRWPVDAPFVPNDWVQSEDGYILELLAITRPFLKRDKEIGRIEALYHFCNCSIRYYNYKDKEVYNRFFGQFAEYERYKHRKNPFDVPGNLDKKLFAKLLKQGLSLFQAFKVAFEPKNRVTVANYFRKLATVLDDEDLMEEIKNELNPFLKKLQEKLSDEKMAEVLAEMIIKPSVKGSKQHIDAWKLGATLLGIDSQLKQSQLPIGPQNKQIEEAPYQEIPNVELPKD